MALLIWAEWVTNLKTQNQNIKVPVINLAGTFFIFKKVVIAKNEAIYILYQAVCFVPRNDVLIKFKLINY
jgi:hypothetical protein